MDESHQSLIKISKTTLQFRQLIQQLRNRDKIDKQTPPLPTIPLENNNLQQNNSQQQPLQLQINEEHPKPKFSFLALEKQFDKTQQSKIGERTLLRKKKSINTINPEVTSRDFSKISLSEKISENNNHLIQQNQSFDRQTIFETKKINAETQYDCLTQDSKQRNSIFQNRSNIKAGQIIRQKGKNISEIQSHAFSKRIRQIDEQIVINYCQTQIKITEKSNPSEIFTFFTNLCFKSEVVIRSPSIKKFKNCIYFGQPLQQGNIYEGFLYFYDGRVYFGQFLNGFKHGLGIQINLIQRSKYRGQFNEGHKTGKFYAETPFEKYIGYLQNGIYQGEGRLTTAEYIYEGLFEKGQKNGYGEQYYPKTGVKISGNFHHGLLEKKKTAKSFAQNSIKIRKGLSNLIRQKQQQKLNKIRNNSFDRHNERMNKIRQKQSRQYLYQMQIDAFSDYKDGKKMGFNTERLQMYKNCSKLPRLYQQYEKPYETIKNGGKVSNNQKIINLIGKNTKKKIQRNLEQLDRFYEKGSNDEEQMLKQPKHLLFRRDG